MDAETDAATTDPRARTYTRREFRIYQLIMDGTHWTTATEAVSSWAIENPDVDMDEEMTWREWTAKDKRDAKKK